MEVNLTENMLVNLYENLSCKIVNDLSKKYNKKEKLIKIMIEMARSNGYNILEAKELINEYEKKKKIIYKIHINSNL